MAILVRREATSGFNCVSCRERVRTCEKYWQVREGTSNVRGERYCLDCERYARMNNDVDRVRDDNYDDDGEAGLRSREEYAAYSAMGCASSYWEDRDAGYAR